MNDANNEKTQSSEISSPALQTLHQAAAGLLFPSETDAPLEPFSWPADTAGTDKALTPEDVAKNLTDETRMARSGARRAGKRASQSTLA